MWLELLVVLDGALLGALLFSLFLFDIVQIPATHPLYRPLLLMALTSGALSVTVVPEVLLPYLAIFETICNIYFLTYTTKQSVKRQ